ncbi:hypothetical protein M404DRAFT_22568 [Pisolithus tinctorius Marx 270]|uniref:CCHC-type domain-containing protein n=1 Tax=Pisolithus tinctorius Marx 270 TaxID=870435 RepID=A0A0C3JI11_PISTI|nr:hypothetical protein M404DRAFT_22568 [Pisolithus tinctorius Marx 270]
MALAWFKPDLLNPKDYDCLLWMGNYCKFLHELATNFCLHDTIANAVQQLVDLTMKDSCWITKYVMESNFWASQVKDYGVSALHHCFYSRLPDCIKDEIAHVNKPSTLAQLHELAQTIDSSKSNNSKSSSSSSSTPKSDAKDKGKQKDLPKSDIAHLLGKDGKVTSAEQWCRMKNNLCLFCGKASHSAKDYPNSTSRTAKAHATMAEALPALPTEKAEPKKLVCSSRVPTQPGGGVDPNCAQPDI